MKNNEHTFVICAYKESPFLEKCIKSLKKQTAESEIIMVTSTPNQHISGLSESYNLPLFVNEGQGGIVQDRHVRVCWQKSFWTRRRSF